MDIVIHKAFVILEALATRKVNTINDISLMTDIPRSTVHRILKALAEDEIVTIKPHKGYVLTPKLISLGLNGIAERELMDIAVPIMRGIAEKTKETVSLNVICGHERVCIYRVEGDRPITRNIRVGDKGPLFIGSAGKVIASGLSPKEMNAMLQKYMANGKIKENEVQDILQQIQKVKEQSFAVSIGERVENCASIAVPVKDIAGYTLASLSISTLADRLHEENKQKYLELLMEASKQISVSQGSFISET